MATRHRVQLAQARHLFGDDIERASFRAHGRIGQLQAARVGVSRARKYRACGAAFDCAAGIHHDDLVADLRREAQIMGNEDDPGAVLSLHVRDQADDRRMHGDVERRRRFVGNDQPGIARKRHGDEHALAHAARKLMRILLQQGAAIPQLRGGEHGDRPFAPLCPVGLPEAGQVLIELAADGHDRIERGQRRLRDECNGATEQCAPSRRRHVDEVAVLKEDCAGRDCEAGRQELRDRAPDHGFARAGFAHQAEDSAGREIERELAYCRHRRAVNAGDDREISDLEDEHGLSTARLPPAARRGCGADRHRGS